MRISLSDFLWKLENNQITNAPRMSEKNFLTQALLRNSQLLPGLPEGILKTRLITCVPLNMGASWRRLASFKS